MKELQLKGKDTRSKIFIEKGLLGQKPYPGGQEEWLLGGDPLKVAIITDSNVAPLYLETVEKKWAASGCEVCTHIVPAGEQFKTIDTLSQIYETLSDMALGRNDLIIALGGGVVGDMAGFVAATYLRGVKHLIQIPTTLLAQVDSSVGGKCGVDLPAGKNLVGAFRQPDRVLIDPAVLRTLSREIFVSGLAEIIKYACIWDEHLWDLLAEDEEQWKLEEIIARCVAIKIHVVEEDETEEGLRRILNFGHTLAHGIEKLGDFTRFSHGEAVAIGMAAMTKIGEAIGVTVPGTHQRLVELLERFDLPTKVPYDREALFNAILTDKKKQGDYIHLIFITSIGKVEQRKTSVKELKEMMKVLGE